MAGCGGPEPEMVLNVGARGLEFSQETQLASLTRKVSTNFWTQVAVVDVVGVLPHVDGQQGLVAGGQRGAGGAHVDDVHRAVGFLTSQVQPEPKLPTAEAWKAFLNSSKLPHLALMASARAPVGAPPPLGFMQFQKKVWFQTWAALL
jgi:hypothetical protein